MLSEKSRHYTDLNLHVQTSGYEVGETVFITLEGPTQKVVLGTVDGSGEAYSPSALKNSTLEIQGKFQ